MAPPDLRGPVVEPRSRLARLRSSLRAAGHEAADMRPWRSGTDCWVDLVTTHDDRMLVLRTPRVESLDTSYDGPTDFGAVLVKEVAALTLAETAGVPVPHVHAIHRGTGEDDPTWMLQSLVSGNSVVPQPGSGEVVGAWVRALHAVRPTDAPLAPPTDWPTTVARRISRRLDAVRRYADFPPSDAVLGPVMGTLADRTCSAAALLHLDVRDANVVYRDGVPVALLDFANALTGDPLLELARIRRFGGLTEDFLRGYGDADLDDPAVGGLVDLYELDTSTLLTLVGAEETDDISLHRDNLTRTQALCARLRGRK
jgi:aminoglycoside phosphotransferase (APT) family kinase protein